MFFFIVDLFDKVQAEMKTRDLCIKPLGGGMMKINNNDITIYGECKVSKMVIALLKIL